MAYNKRTKEFEKFNPATNVGKGDYSVEEKKKMIRDAGYTGFKDGVNLTDEQFLDLFYREGPNGKMTFKPYLADKYFNKDTTKSGTAPAPGASAPATDGSGTPGIWGGSQMADEFDRQTSDAINAAEGVFDVRAGRKREGFDRERERMNTDINRNREDYAKYTSREQVDFNRNIAAQDKGFARKLSNAASAYGQRWLLRAGFARSEIAEATRDHVEDQDVYRLDFNRQMQDADTKNARGEENFRTGYTDIDRRQAEFGYDAGNERRNIAREGQAAADKIWNEGMIAGDRNAQDIQKGKSLDKAYGRTGAPTAPAYRRGGKYITTGI